MIRFSRSSSSGDRAGVESALGACWSSAMRYGAPSSTETIVALWNCESSPIDDRSDLAEAVEAGNRRRGADHGAGDVDLAAGARAEEEAAGRAGQQERGVGRAAAGEPRQRLRDRRSCPVDDLVGRGDRELHRRALGHAAEEGDRARGLVEVRGGAEVEARRIDRVEHRQRIGDRRWLAGAGTEVAVEEADRRLPVDLDDAAVLDPRDHGPRADAAPARLDAEGVVQRAGEQEDRDPAVGDLGPGELQP